MRSVILILLLFYQVSIQANENKKDDNQARKIVYGIYLEELIRFAGGEFTTTLSPFSAYRPVERIYTGVGGKYIYSSFTGSRYHSYGATIFFEFSFIKEIHTSFPAALFLHNEFEYLSIDRGNLNPGRVEQQLFWLGPGIRQPLNQNASVNFYLLWNLVETTLAPKSPAIRFSIIF